VPPITRVVIFRLVGDPPAELHLPPLETIATTATTIRDALAPFLAPDAVVEDLSDLAQLERGTQSAALTVAYLVGHAWVDRDGRYMAAARRSGVTEVLTAPQILTLLADLVEPAGRGLCFVDTCVAAALGAALPGPLAERWTFIFASSAAENALEYPFDRATRFSLALRDALARTARDIDAVGLALILRDKLAEPGLMPPQAVSYWHTGSPLVLSRRDGRRGIPATWRTHRILRTILVALGALVAVAAIAGAIYYRTHERIRVDLGDLATIAADVRVEVYRLMPTLNSRTLLASHAVGTTSVFRTTVPATDLLIVVTGRFHDGHPRAIHFHLAHAPSWDLLTKASTLRVPPAEDVRAHPDMAFIPAGPWLGGQDGAPVMNPRAFWIDLTPVTVDAYLPYAAAAVADGTLDPNLSVVLHDVANHGGMVATGLTQLPKLVGDLGAVFSVLDAAERPVARNAPYTDVAAMLPHVQIACRTCPAPMTLQEAQSYCRSRRMRLPTQPEWELAARGADGRRFPWGNAWADTFGNAGLPTTVGTPKRPEPASKYPGGASPLGVLDMVGNEGDWVAPDGPSGSPLFAGGQYRQNGDDCTVFALTPDTGEILPWYEITCRCVSEAGPIRANGRPSLERNRP
jgi:formylglycine-generating enzyme required for sulfatase activity